MANNKLILKNTTISEIVLDEGFTVPASSQITIDPTLRMRFWDDIDVVGGLAASIRSGNIVVNDGVNDITDVERAIDYLKIPDRAFNLRFESEPERSNDFLAKNIQEAIEEARDMNTAVTGRTYLITFYNNGNTANKWLYHIPTSEATDQLPYHSGFDLDVYGIIFGNKNTNIDCDVEFYVNGTTAPFKVFTLEVRDSRFYYKTTVSSIFSVAVGDDISIFIKKVGASTPASVEINLHVRINSNNVGEAGEN